MKNVKLRLTAEMVADVLATTADIEASTKDARLTSGLFTDDIAYLRAKYFSQFATHKLSSVYDFVNAIREMAEFIDQMISYEENNHEMNTDGILVCALLDSFARGHNPSIELVKENFSVLVYISEISNWIIGRAIDREDSATIYGLYSVLARYIMSCILSRRVVSDYDFLWWVTLDTHFKQLGASLRDLYKELARFYKNVLDRVEFHLNWEACNEENN